MFEAAFDGELDAMKKPRPTTCAMESPWNDFRTAGDEVIPRQLCIVQRNGHTVLRFEFVFSKARNIDGETAKLLRS